MMFEFAQPLSTVYWSMVTSIRPVVSAKRVAPRPIAWSVAVVDVMADTVYNTPDGVEVVLEEETGWNHIQHRHEEVTRTDIGSALSQSVRVCAHTSIPRQRMYQGVPRPTGFHRHSFPIVVVEMVTARTGRVVTAYLTRLAYPGRQLWPPLTTS